MPSGRCSRSVPSSCRPRRSDGRLERHDRNRPDREDEADLLLGVLDDHETRALRHVVGSFCMRPRRAARIASARGRMIVAYTVCTTIAMTSSEKISIRNSAGFDFFMTNSCRGRGSDVDRERDVEVGTYFLGWLETLWRTRRRSRLFRRCRVRRRRLGGRLVLSCAGGCRLVLSRAGGCRLVLSRAGGRRLVLSRAAGVGSFEASPVVSGSAGGRRGRLLRSHRSDAVGGGLCASASPATTSSTPGPSEAPDNSWQHHLTPHNAPAGNRDRHAGCRRSHDRLHAVP